MHTYAQPADKQTAVNKKCSCGSCPKCRQENNGNEQLKATEKNVESRFSKDFSRIPVHGASLEGDEKAEQA